VDIQCYTASEIDIFITYKSYAIAQGNTDPHLAAFSPHCGLWFEKKFKKLYLAVRKEWTKRYTNWIFI